MNEMNKLHAMLLKAGIYHTFGLILADIFGANGLQIHIYRDNTFQKELDVVVFHEFSNGHERGLLETYILGSGSGYETAEQVFEGWKEKFFS